MMLGEKFPFLTSSMIQLRAWYRWVSSPSENSLAETSPSREARWQISDAATGLKPVRSI